MNKINYFMPSINGQIISCEYEIKVSLYFDCFVDYNHRPRVIIPIYLVHQLPIDYQLEIQEQIDFENALKKSKMEEEDNKYFNNKLMKNKDNYNNKMDNMNEIEEDNELPSLEVIEEAHKNQIKDNENKINLNKINVINDNNVINNNNELIDDETKRNNNNLLTNENNSKPEQSGADLLNLNVKKENITNGLFKEGDVTIEEQAAKKLLKN
jgi:hypothetical protein